MVTDGLLAPPLAVATRIAAALPARAAEGDRLRRLPDATVADLRQSGLLRLFVPACYGGLDQDIATGMRVLEAIAYGDGSTAWVLGNTTGFTSGMPTAALPESLLQAELAGRDVIHAASGHVEGRAQRHGDTYLVEARATFLSGVDHADYVWFVVPVVDQDGAPVAPGPAGQIYVCVSRAEVAIDDIWHTTGLRATGSNEARVRTTVAAERVIPRTAVLEARLDGPFRIARLGTLVALKLVLGPICTGIARSAFDSLVALLADRRAVWANGALEADLPGTRYAAADAMLDIEAARALWERESANCDAALAEASLPREAVEHGARLAALFAVQACTRATERIFRTAGPRAVFEGMPIQRCFRDVETAAQTFAVVPQALGLDIGRVALGRAPGA